MKLTFLGHSSIKIQIKSTTMYVDLWYNGPTFPASEKNKVEDNALLLVSHGHFDHFETSFELAKSKNIKVISSYDLMVWMIQHGIAQEKLLGMNKGGTINLSDNISISMVTADHSSTIQYEDKLYAGGEPAGFIIKESDEKKIYYSGDTAVFGDMRLITEFHKPSIAILPIGGLFTMSGKEVAYALDHLLTSVKKVIPIHYGTFDFLSGTPEEIKKHLKRKDVEFKVISVGETFSL